MSYTYSTWLSAVAGALPISPTDTNFLAQVPTAIDYGEQRIYRELNLLNTDQVDASTVLTPSQRTASIPQTFIVVNSMALLTPAGATQANGTRKPLTQVSVEVVNALWPAANASTGEPEMFAMQDQWTPIFGPSPNAAYAVEVVGTYRPTPLGPSNQTTFLCTYLPDLFFVATMISFSLWQRNFAAAGGGSGNDPMMGGNYESQYQALFTSANSEEARKKGWGASWTAYPVAPQAQPQRG